MKVVPQDARGKSRSLVTTIGIVSVPIFGAIFYLLYTMIRRLSPGIALLVLAGGAGFLAYLVWIFAAPPGNRLGSGLSKCDLRPRCRRLAGACPSSFFETHGVQVSQRVRLSGCPQRPARDTSKFTL